MCIHFCFSTIKVDEFTGRLFKLYETVRKEGVSQVIEIILIAIMCVDSNHLLTPFSLI